MGPSRQIVPLPPRKHPPAFTLIELVVAIAIIALLVTLVVPSIGRARDHAKLTICKTRLRNVGLGLAMYAQDNESRLPMVEKMDNPHAELLAALRGPYVTDPRNFYCPSETRPHLRFSRQNLANGDVGYFYYSCRRASTNQAASGFLRFDVTWPRELAVTMDPDTWTMSDCWFRDERTPHWYYHKGVNYLMLDGRVDMVTASPRSAFK